jgi:amyloid beta precursor protein binding protein 1
MSIFNDPCTNLTPKSSPFWIITAAVKEFVKTVGGGMLPLQGSIPDMKADTDSYVKLQMMYL